MIRTIDAMLYFYLLMGQRMMGNIEKVEPPRVAVDYCSYTTNHIMTNNDMYSIDEIYQQILIDQVKEEEQK